MRPIDIEEAVKKAIENNIEVYKRLKPLKLEKPWKLRKSTIKKETFHMMITKLILKLQN